MRCTHRHCAEIVASCVGFRDEISNVFDRAQQRFQAKETGRETDMALQRTGAKGKLTPGTSHTTDSDNRTSTKPHLLPLGAAVRFCVNVVNERRGSLRNTSCDLQQALSCVKGDTKYH